jgi:imidazole glycerol-phosphate synthase subunit HisH
MSVVVIDYGIGNLFSVRRAFEHCGSEVVLSSDPAVLADAPRLVLPGVGAFADGMRGLIERGLDKVILAYAESGRPLLGICLGMQMLASVSEEFGEHKGLGIIPGRVVSIPRVGPEGQQYKVPHVGWADLCAMDPTTDWKDSVLDGLSSDDAVYLTHSYAVTVMDPRHNLAYCKYNGANVTAAIRKNKVFGVQFHPEKSGKVGLRIIANFSKI